MGKTTKKVGEIFFRLVTEYAYAVKYVCYIQAWWLNRYLGIREVFGTTVFSTLIPNQHLSLRLNISCRTEQEDLIFHPFSSVRKYPEKQNPHALYFQDF